MKRFLVSVAVLLLAGCSDSIAPCTELCRPGEVVVKIELLDDVFEPLAVRNGVPYWGPGDSIAVRFTIENATASALDSVFFQAATFNALDDTYRDFPNVAAHSRIQFVDTLSITDFVYENPQKLHIALWTTSGDSAIQPLVEGDSLVHLVTRSFAIELLTLPDPQVVQRPNRDPLTVATIRARTPTGFLLRLRNDSELPTLPTRLTSCWWDIDFCAEQFAPSDVIPAIQPGATFDLELPVDIQTPDRILYPWSRGLAAITICSPARRSAFDCKFVPVMILPNIEALCAVHAVEPGVVTTARPADCGADDLGSAYRFVASKGERYRVETSGVANAGFIVDADGTAATSRTDPEKIEVTITRDGTYYVIIPSAGITSFRLIRI